MKGPPHQFTVDVLRGRLLEGQGQNAEWEQSRAPGEDSTGVDGNSKEPPGTMPPAGCPPCTARTDNGG